MGHTLWLSRTLHALTAVGAQVAPGSKTMDRHTQIRQNTHRQTHMHGSYNLIRCDSFQLSIYGLEWWEIWSGVMRENRIIRLFQKCMSLPKRKLANGGLVMKTPQELSVRLSLQFTRSNLTSVIMSIKLFQFNVYPQILISVTLFLPVLHRM